MKLKLFLVGILILLMISIPTHAGVTVDKTIIDIVAGDSFTIRYQLTYSGKDTMCYVSTTITPDGDGINLTYNSSFLLTSTTPSFDIVMKTNIRLAPQSYILTTTFDIEQPTPVSRSHHHTVVASPVVVIPPVTPPVDDVDDSIPPIIIPVYIDETPNEWNPLYSVAIAIVAIIVITLLFLMIKKKRKKK
jgi:hypothetical protein